MIKHSNLHALEHIFLYQFNNPALLEEALTHPSISSHKSGIPNYERMEFLGDAVLGLVVTEMLMRQFTQEPEGDLAKRRAALVCRDALTQIARELQLGHFLMMTEGEAASGGRDNPANLENMLEAVIGALYLDGGLDAAKPFILRYWEPLSQTMSSPPKDPKTTLQEWAQSRGKAIPVYEVIATQGPSHAPIFTVEVRVQNLPGYRASATSKRLAEREAARLLLEYINAQTSLV